MEQLNDLQAILNQLGYPAFLARDGFITAINTGAGQRMAETGMAIPELLATGAEEYEHFQSGCLYVTLTLGGTLYNCTITKLRDHELFSLDESSASSALQALSLAASQLRSPVSELSLELSRLRSSDDELMSMVNQSLNRLQRIISNMSDAAAFLYETPQKTTQEMCSLFQSVLEKSQALLSHSGIQLQYQLPQQPVFSIVDADMLTRAVYNLLSNAAKFSSRENAIEVTLKKTGNKLYLTVCDNGDGIDNALRGTMFSRYKRQPGIEDPRHGLGLGMTLIHAAATAHGGTVLVEQPAGKGTRITMSLVIQKSPGTTVRAPILKPDMYGGQDQALIELSDVLPHTLYDKKKY